LFGGAKADNVRSLDTDVQFTIVAPARDAVHVFGWRNGCCL
jgi:hypothetical protein